MKTNQKSNLTLLFSALFMFLSSLACFGQWGIVRDIQVENESVDHVEISITPPSSNAVSKEFRIGDTIYSGSKLTVPKRTKLIVVSKFNNKRTIRGLLETTYTVTESGEGQRVIGNNNDGSVLNEVSNEVNGGVTATSSGKTVSLKTTATEFLVTANGKDLTYDLIKGKVVINRRVKVEFSEDLAIDSTNKRKVFVNEPQNLTLKNPRFSYNSDSLLQNSLNTGDDVEKFFKKQLGEQKRTLLNAGSLTRSAFKLLNSSTKNNADSLALDTFEKSILSGEIRRDLFIQSALLLSEAYLRNGKKENSALWLNVALHFAELEFKESQELYSHYLSSGENEAAKAFGSDLVFANEYYAWAYTVKLKLTGCLEAVDQNPRKWLKDAENLRTDLDKL